MQHSTLTALLLCLLVATQATAQRPKLIRFQDETTKKYGVRTLEWKYILAPVYDEIEPNPDTIFAAKVNGVFGTYNYNGDPLISLAFEAIQPHANGFKSQFGYAAVSRKVKEPNSWGLRDSKGDLVVMEIYQYVRAITPDLFAAIKNPDTVIHIWNRQQVLYKIPGKAVIESDIDRTCFGAKQLHGNPDIWYTLEGKQIVAPDGNRGYWTNGAVTVAIDKNGKFGLISAKGKELAPYVYTNVRAGVSGQLIFTERDANYANPQEIAVTLEGKTIVPKGNHGIKVHGQYYRVGSNSTNTFKLFDAQGKEILAATSASQVSFSHDLKHLSAQVHPEQFMQYQTSDNEWVLVNNLGQMTKTSYAYGFKYQSDEHHIIGRLKVDGKQQPNRNVLIDAQTLKPIDEKTYNKLDFTSHPRVYIALIESARKYSFIKTDPKVEVPTGQFDYLHWWDTDVYAGKLDDSIMIYDQNFRVAYAGPGRDAQKPQRDDYFHAGRQGWPRLLAIVEKSGLPLFITARGTYEVDRTKAPYLQVPIPAPTTPPPGVEEYIEKVEEAPPPPAAPQEAAPWTGHPEGLVMTMVEQMPQFPGGNEALLAFVKQNLRYPTDAKAEGVEGRVYVQFIVERDGSITNQQVVRGLHKSLNEEALRIVPMLPKWSPGMQHGKPVRVKFTMPVQFSLK